MQLWAYWADRSSEAAHICHRRIFLDIIQQLATYFPNNKRFVSQRNQPGKLISIESFSLKFDLNMISNTGLQIESIARLQ